MPFTQVGLAALGLCSGTTARSRKPRCARGIFLAGVREAMGAGGMEVVCIDPKNENGQPGSDSQLADSA